MCDDFVIDLIRIQVKSTIAFMDAKAQEIT